jgi:hypothetical protein
VAEDHPGKPDTLDPEVVERLISRDVEEQRGKPLSRRTRETQRSLEAYMKAGVRPRWSERLSEIEREKRFHERTLDKHLKRLRAEHPDPEALRRAWTAVAESWDFGKVNDLVDAHNQWFPIERDLPMNPRTGDYLPIMGRSYRRERFGPDWVLERFPV